MTRLASLACGLGLSTLFFLPIVAASHVDPPLMMWTHRDTGELAAAWLLGGALGGAAVWLTSRLTRPRVEAAITLFVTLPSALSVVAVTGRAGALTWSPASLTQWLGLAALAGGPLLAAWLWWRHPRVLTRTVRYVLPFGALLALPAVRPLWSMPASPEPRPPLVQRAAPASSCRSVVVVVFDEWSYDGLFGPGRAVRPSMAAWAARARIYHHARSGTDTTNTSIAAYVRSAATRGGTPAAAVLGPFGTARRLGLETEAVGWYYPYCESLGGLLDRCSAISLYNASTSFDGFNPLAPVATALTIWPYQMPTGLAKRPVATWLHGRALEHLVSRGAAPADRPTFRWIHLNIPHEPWLQGSGVLAWHAFTKTRDRYDRQLVEVDRSIDTLMRAFTAVSDGSRPIVVLTADHGARRVPAGGPRHVPLLVFEPRGAREDVDTPVDVADVIGDVVARACVAR